jgi:uncharacterized membrane protein YwaF
MVDFIRRFFGYFQYEDEQGVLGIPETYRDGLGGGAFSDWRHFAWMLIVIILCVGLYQLFKRYPKAGRKTIVSLSIYLFSVRLVNQMARVIIGAEVPAWRAFPFHMCTILSFLLPLVVVFNWNKIKTAVYTLSVMGGTITIILGDYFDNLFLTFASLEGMLAHTILLLVPIIDVAIGQFKFEFKKSWQVFVGIGLLLIWASLANNVFFKDYDDVNYMYLEQNGLPGNLGGDYYFGIYSFLFLVFFGLIFEIPSWWRRRGK